MPLDNNLTGEQIQQVLDLFLYKALEPIILNTDVFDAQVSYILALVSANRKRKPSSLPRDRVIEVLCLYLVSTDRNEKFRLLREAKLERSFLHVFATRVLRKHSKYLRRYREFITGSRKTRLSLKRRLDADATSLGCESRQGLYRIASVSGAYLQRFYEVRTLVMEHYLKQASRQAKAFIESSSGNFDFRDVRQSILKGTLLALDKYDSDKGALTSYIGWWTWNALTCGASEHEYGLAYTVPQTQRKRIAEHTTGFLNYSVSLDDLGSSDDGPAKSLHQVVGDGYDLEGEIERNQENSIVRYLAKHADLRGCARLVLDIGEYFSERELAAMRKQTREECGKL